MTAPDRRQKIQTLIEELRDAVQGGPEDVTPDMLTDAADELSRLTETHAALIVQWRESAAWEVENSNPHYGQALDQCADELEAVAKVTWAING